MPTRRMIDPSFWQSESMAELTQEGRLFFLGLISNADDQGRLKAHPALLRSLIYPYDDISTEVIEQHIEALNATGSIFIYGNEGRKFIQIVKWWEYQSPQWAYPSKIPPPENWQDRLRYREDNQLKQDNWDGEGGFIEPDKGKALPKALGKELGSPIELELELDTNNDDEDETHAGAQGDLTPEETKLQTITRLYTENITISIAPMTAQEMQQAEYFTLPVQWWEESVKIAADNNARKWSYVRGILDRSIKAGVSPHTLGPPTPKGDSNERNPRKESNHTGTTRLDVSPETRDAWDTVST